MCSKRQNKIYLVLTLSVFTVHFNFSLSVVNLIWRCRDESRSNVPFGLTSGIAQSALVHRNNINHPPSTVCSRGWTDGNVEDLGILRKQCFHIYVRTYVYVEISASKSNEDGKWVGRYILSLSLSPHLSPPLSLSLSLWLLVNLMKMGSG